MQKPLILSVSKLPYLLNGEYNKLVNIHKLFRNVPGKIDHQAELDRAGRAPEVWAIPTTSWWHLR